MTRNGQNSRPAETDPYGLQAIILIQLYLVHLCCVPLSWVFPLKVNPFTLTSLGYAPILISVPLLFILLVTSPPKNVIVLLPFNGSSIAFF